MSSSNRPIPVAQPGADRPAEQQPEPAPETREPAAERPPRTDVPAPTPSVPFAPKGRLRAPPRSTAPGVSSILQMVAYAPWSNNERLDVNTYVPNASCLFQFLHNCDTQMLSADRFTRGHPQWTPYISRVYIAMLFYFRIMDCMVLSGIADSYLLNLLLAIKNEYDFQRLMIPGPLVPIFQSLSVCNSGNELIGDISPTLPDITTAAGTTFYVSLPYLSVPNVLALLDYPSRIAHAAADPVSDANLYSAIGHSSYSLHSQAVPNANDANMQAALSGPGMKNEANVVYESTRNFWRNRLRLSLPPRVPDHHDNSTHLNWHQFLRFAPVPGEHAHANFSLWFGNVAQVMSNYCSYFRDSTSLGSIPVAAGAAPHVMLQYQTVTGKQHPSTLATYVAAVATPATAAHYDQPCLTTLSCTGLVKAPGVPEVHLQIGTLSQTNAQSPVGLTDVVHHTGPAWTVSPDQKHMSTFDIIGNIPSYVSTLHSTRAIE